MPSGQGARGEPGHSTRCKDQPRSSPSLWQSAGTAGSAGCYVQLAASPMAPSLLLWVGSTQCHPGTGQDLPWDPPAVGGCPASVLEVPPGSLCIICPRGQLGLEEGPFPKVPSLQSPRKGESHRLSP